MVESFGGGSMLEYESEEAPLRNNGKNQITEKEVKDLLERSLNSEMNLSLNSLERDHAKPKSNNFVKAVSSKPPLIKQVNKDSSFNYSMQSSNELPQKSQNKASHYAIEQNL